MATGLLQVIEHIRQGGETATDGQLLARFVATRDEAAFAALVRRHGPMVLGVCRRVLHDVHDAEDAFQATFLVLARKAGSVVRRDSVGCYLYRVAYHTALEARAANARRRARERPMKDLPHPEVAPAEARDWLPLLDRELGRLPEKYRAAVVLCDLEGQSRREAARQLGVPEGTLSGRLTTARRRLARRLARWGLAFSGGGLAALLAENAASACVSPGLFLSTTRAALLTASGQAAVAGVVSAEVVALTEGVMKAMFLHKLKTVTVVLVGVVALGLGTGGVMYQGRAGAADPHKVVQLLPGARADLAQDEDDGQQKAKKPKDQKRAAEEVQALRDQLEEARRQLAELKAEVERQRQRAEEAARQAQLQLQKARAAEEAARRDAEKRAYAARIQQAQEAFNKTVGSGLREGQSSLKEMLGQLEEKAAQVRKQFEQQRQAVQGQLKMLEAQLKTLDEQERKVLSDLRRQRDEWVRQQRTAPPPKQQGAGGDKLDRILERLDQIEKRLNRIEQGSPAEKRKKKVEDDRN
jgi:RNA polymerase sigma-70 factor (ECF subfamily)